MKKVLIVAGILLLSALLSAEIGYWPRLSLIEMGLNTTDSSCDYARAGLGVLEGDFTRSEAVAACYYTGDLGSDGSDIMNDLLNITAWPTAIFDRDERLTVAGPEIAEAYEELLMNNYYASSPVQMEITSFSTATGAWEAVFTMHNTDLLLINVPVQAILIEDDVNGQYDHVTRAVSQHTLTLGGQGSTETLTGTFTIDSGWNADNLHLIVVLADDSGAFVQAASDYAGEFADLQPAVPFDLDVVGPSWSSSGNYTYNGDFFGLVNYGETSSFAADLIGENVPTGMSLMYCYEDSQGGAGCFNPSGGPFEFTLDAGDWIMFHLLIPTVNQTCMFNYMFTFASVDRPDPLEVPFSFRTEDYVSVNDDTAPVTVARLNQNSPNPFNPSTQISFNMAVSGAVQLDVYDIRGGHVCSLVNETLAAGDHAVTWNGRDDDGRAVSSGVYLYRLATGTGSETRRMVLLK